MRPKSDYKISSFVVFIDFPLIVVFIAKFDKFYTHKNPYFCSSTVWKFVSCLSDFLLSIRLHTFFLSHRLSWFAGAYLDKLTALRRRINSLGLRMFWQRNKRCSFFADALLGQQNKQRSTSVLLPAEVEGRCRRVEHCSPKKTAVVV